MYTVRAVVVQDVSWLKDRTRITPSNDVIINVSDTDGFASILLFHEPPTPLSAGRTDRIRPSQRSLSLTTTDDLCMHCF